MSVSKTIDCGDEAFYEGGNWFCHEAEKIVYGSIGGRGSFREVIGMGSDGQCDKIAKYYQGPFAPLDEDLSVHIRGPFHLREFAVYNLSPVAKRDETGAGDQHNNNPKHKQRLTNPVTATIDGHVVSWENNWERPSGKAQGTTAEDSATKSRSNSEPARTTSGTEASPTTGNWHRVAYYNAEAGTRQNVVFMGNYGGQGSGEFDSVWGNSLSYLNADGLGGSSSPQTLKDVTIPSNKEFAIFSAAKCDESCGFSRAADIAYKGYDGVSKVFLFRFKMPLDGERGPNGDMPALWLLNGRIPRTAQYGTCSCWDSGCGEFDIFEVLSQGDTKCKSTFHLDTNIGSTYWFARPTDEFIKVAVVFSETTYQVAISLLNDVEFSSSLAGAVVSSWVEG